jgi:hypothetical protein
MGEYLQQSLKSLRRYIDHGSKLGALSALYNIIFRAGIRSAGKQISQPEVSGEDVHLMPCHPKPQQNSVE